MRMLMQYRVDGMVLASASPSETAAQEYLRTGGRLVLINREPERMPATGIACDNPRIGRELAERMLAVGYQRFALLRGDPTVKFGLQRALAFRSAIEASVAAGSCRSQRRVGLSSGRAFGNEMMALAARPDAIVCATDVVGSACSTACGSTARWRCPTRSAWSASATSRRRLGEPRPGDRAAADRADDRGVGAGAVRGPGAGGRRHDPGRRRTSSGGARCDRFDRPRRAALASEAPIPRYGGASHGVEEVEEEDLAQKSAPSGRPPLARRRGGQRRPRPKAKAWAPAITKIFTGPPRRRSRPG